MRKKDKQEIIAALEQRYSGIGTALHYNSPFELLCAVIMSAQCTDERVNKITARIFPRLNTPEKMGVLTQEQLEAEIKDCGLYHAKAKNLLGMCHMLTEEFGGVVPSDIPTLMKLPGVGRKTADVIASVVYKIPAIAVDTHVARVSKRLGYAEESDEPEKIEIKLERRFPKEVHIRLHYQIILFGRTVCHAKKPECERCELCSRCLYFKKSSSIKGRKS